MWVSYGCLVLSRVSCTANGQAAAKPKATAYRQVSIRPGAMDGVPEVLDAWSMDLAFSVDPQTSQVGSAEAYAFDESPGNSQKFSSRGNDHFVHFGTRR